MKKMVEAVDSRTKIQKVFDEEEQMSQNFKISNFYSNHRLNMVELKNRLEQFKKKHNQLVPPFKVDELSREIEPEVSFPQPTKYAAYSSAEAPLEKEKITLPPAHRQRLSAYDEGGGGGG